MVKKTLDFLYENTGYISKLIKLVEYSGVADCICRILAFENPEEMYMVNLFIITLGEWVYNFYRRKDKGFSRYSS